MKRYKYIFFAAVVLLFCTAVHAQEFHKDSVDGYAMVRTKTWSLVAAGGAGGFNSFRGAPANGAKNSVAPDVSLGLKFNIKPWLRTGMTVGYTKVKVESTANDTLTTITNNYSIGGYNNGKLITNKMMMDDRHDEHIIYTDLSIDVNMLRLFKGSSQRWGLWFGAGVGYLFGWYRNTQIAAFTEEAVANGTEYSNVYNNDGIRTEVTKSNVNTLYIPLRLSLEYDITPHWTMGINGGYKILPCNKELTPKGMWNGGVSLAYNFTRYDSPKNVMQRNTAEVQRLNDRINALRRDSTAFIDSLKYMRAKIDSTRDSLANSSYVAAVAKSNELYKIPISVVFFSDNSAKLTKQQLNNLSVIKDIMTKDPYARLYIKGYASQEGSVQHSKDLAYDRANVVAKVFIKNMDISPERISVESHGPVNTEFFRPELNSVVEIFINW